MNQQLVQKSTDKIFASKNTDELIDVMKEQAETAEREKILNAMTPECRKKLEYIDTWLRNEVSHTLRSRYEPGLQVKELYEDERKNGGKIYGKNAISNICKLLDWDDGLIRMALRFVQQYSRDDLEYPCKIRLPSGEPLTWSHVRCLVSVDDKKLRKELLDKTLAEGLTCMDLAHELKRLLDHTANDGRGRPLRMPKDFDSALAQQQYLSEDWDKRFTKVWAKHDRTLEAQAAKLAPEEVTEERLNHARHLAIQLRRVAKEASEQADMAEQVVKKFERILDERRHVEMTTESDTTPHSKTSSKQPPAMGNEKYKRHVKV